MGHRSYGTEYLEKEYGFDALTSEKFKEFLRDLQEGSPYQWPNRYFIWEKPDDSLFIVSIHSTQTNHLLTYEYTNTWAGPEYCGRIYGIYPPSICSYQRTVDGKSVSFDPVEELVEAVSGYEYVGTWLDPDVLMDDPHGFNRVLACGRWELAVSMICPERLEEFQQMRGLKVDAALRAATKESCGGCVKGEHGRDVEM